MKCSGFLVAKELDAFAKVLDKAAKPVLAISGGAKVSDKISSSRTRSMRTTMISSWWWRLATTKAMCAVAVLEELLCPSTSVCTIWTTTFLISATLDRASTPIRPEAMAVEVEAVDFPEVYDDRKDEATRCDVMTEEVLVPVKGAPLTGWRVDRFRQSSGRRPLVSTPLWSLRYPMCPLWLIIGKAALRDEGERYADDRDAFAAQEERCSSWRRARWCGRLRSPGSFGRWEWQATWSGFRR